MLQSLRDYFPKWLFAFLLGILCLLIVGTGIYMPFNLGSQSKNTVLVRINKAKIRKNQLEAALESLKQQQAQMGVNFRITPETESELLRGILHQLVQQEILKQRAYSSNYRIHPQTVLNSVRKIPSFQVEGEFSPKRFAEMLVATGQTKTVVLEKIKNHQLIGQLEKGLLQSAFILPKEIQQFIRFAHQARDFSYLELKVKDFLQTIPVISDEALQTYYEKSLPDFRIPEKVSVDYITLSYQDALQAIKAAPLDNPDHAEEKAIAKFKASIEQLTHLSYTHPHSLKEIAEALNVPIETTTLFSRKNGLDEITTHSGVISAAFSQKVLKGHNSPLLRLDSERILLLRIKQHEPLRLPAFDEVKEKVKEALSLQKAKEATYAYGEQLLEKLQKDPTVPLSLPTHSQWKTEKAKQDSETVPNLILRAAFTMPHQGKMQPIKGMVMPNGDYVVIRLSKVRHGKVSQLDERQYEAFKAEVKQMVAQFDYIHYAYANEKRTKVDYLFNLGI